MTAPRKLATRVAAAPTVSVEPEYYDAPQDSLAGELLASGAAPVPVDVAQMIADLQAMAAKQATLIAQLMADRGVPTDPIGAQLQALQDHLAVQAIANPNHKEVYKPVQDYAGALDSASLTVNQMARLRNMVDDLPDAHELGYVKHLAKSLHNSTLDVE